MPWFSFIFVYISHIDLVSLPYSKKFFFRILAMFSLISKNNIIDSRNVFIDFKKKFHWFQEKISLISRNVFIDFNKKNFWIKKKAKIFFSLKKKMKNISLKIRRKKTITSKYKIKIFLKSGIM